MDPCLVGFPLSLQAGALRGPVKDPRDPQSAMNLHLCFLPPALLRDGGCYAEDHWLWDTRP